jgi:AhpD family alkylhydroperoxidase
MTTMTQPFSQLTANINKSLRQLRAHQPDLMHAFGALSQAATRDGVVSHKHKELTALALGVAGHCDACIGFHTQALAKAGATRAEIEEILGVAVYMGGGPSLMYAASALAAFDEATATAAAA